MKPQRHKGSVELQERQRADQQADSTLLAYEREDLAAIDASSDAAYDDMCRVCWLVVCCCVYRTPSKEKPPDDPYPLVWLWCWLLLLGTCWMPIAGGAIYALDHNNAPQLQWYWCWPLLLLGFGTLLTTLEYHMLPSAYELDTFSSGHSMEGARFQSAAINISLLVLIASSVMLSFIFASRDYWQQSLPDHRPVDSVPALLALISTAMGVLSLLCRLRQLYLLDVIAIAERGY